MSANLAATLDEKEYKRRVRAWTLYDWANSAFATTIMAAVLPVYYSQVAGATLPSASVATAYWSAGLSISLFIVAILSPILGTISDVMRGKKKFLSIFFGLGVVGTGLLVLVDTGDWLLASILFILGRIGFTGANVFYDALLPHVAKEEDLDRVSTRGYALGYLGGGVLLAIDIAMIQFFPGTLGARLSFLSVAIWWIVFSIPLFLRIPEPPAATEKLAPGENVVSVSFKRLWKTLGDIQQYRELFKYLLAFLIYIDGIGTIIGVAAIYGAELGFGSIELILALLLVQFVGVPFSLIFGRLPSKKEKNRPFYFAFILFNLIALPLGGVLGRRLLPSQITGNPLPPYEATATAVGEGLYDVNDPHFQFMGAWQQEVIPAEVMKAKEDAPLASTTAVGASYLFTFNGQRVDLEYASGPDCGIWEVQVDGKKLTDPKTGEVVTIDAYNKAVHYGMHKTIDVGEPGEHTLALVNTGSKAPESSGNRMTIAKIKVLPPLRQSNLGIIIGIIVGIELLGALIAWLVGKPLFGKFVEKLTTKTSIMLALVVYAIIAVWGYFLNSVIEFWFLAWMVAVVQGGSQALSRSLFSYMSPASKSGEFFGLFGIMEKFSAILGPLVFAFAATTFGSSRPAILSIIAFFIVGGYILTRVDVEKGRKVAVAEDAKYLKGAQG